MAGFDTFLGAVTDAALSFPDNKICRQVLSGQVTMQDYHEVLLVLFHTSSEAANVSALAAANCPVEQDLARDYLLTHAARIKENWRWLKADLAATGYAGPDPGSLFPSPACQSYVAYNYYVALKAPVARLAIIAVMNAITSNFSQNYSTKLFQVLKLKPAQTSFFFRGGATPEDDLTELARKLKLSEREWLWMANAATTAATLYRNLYDTATS
jgi:hypothetical protein